MSLKDAMWLSIDDELQKIRERRNHQLEDLQEQIGKVVDQTYSTMKLLVREKGFVWCKDCDGTGAVARLDAGYMRRFGLREWDGCGRCGGQGDRRGCGYYSKE